MWMSVCMSLCIYFHFLDNKNSNMKNDVQFLAAASREKFSQGMDIPDFLVKNVLKMVSKTITSFYQSVIIIRIIVLTIPFILIAVFSFLHYNYFAE